MCMHTVCPHGRTRVHMVSCVCPATWFCYMCPTLSNVCVRMLECVVVECVSKWLNVCVHVVECVCPHGWLHAFVHMVDCVCPHC